MPSAGPVAAARPALVRALAKALAAVPTGRYGVLLAASLALVLVSGCSTIRRTLAPLGLTTVPGYNYDVRIVGVGGRLEDRLQESSVLFQEKYDPPDTLRALRRRAQADRDVYLRVMRSRAWYDGEVTWEIDEAAKPPMVSMHVTRGERYRLTRMDIEGLPEDAAELATTEGLESLGVTAGDPALAETVLLAEARLLAALAAKGYPYAVIPPREARIDRRSRTMEVLLRVDPGPRAVFGDVRVEGLVDVEEDLVRRRLAFEAGEPFSPAKLEETRKALFATGVFSSVTLSWGKRGDIGADGRAPIVVLVTEGKMHTIGLGLKYSSADGPGGRAFWEDRNLRGGAERLRAEIEYSERIGTGELTYRQPDWFRVGQSLLLGVTADADKPPAYDRYALSLSAGIERQFTKAFVATAGVVLEQDNVNSAADADGTKDFTLIGIPIGLRYDASDNILDPGRGHRTLAGMTPYFSVLGSQVEMLYLRLTESVYIPLDSEKRKVWATRVSVGSVIGPQRKDIPADKRLYAGGGDSVRGYRFQFAGPLRDIDPFLDDPTGKPKFKPLGGKSLLQIGTELRWKATKTFGVVPFVEGAGLYDPSYPDFNEDMHWAAGLGFRYFTIAGPIRLDLGFPLNPRPSDNIFEIYISLGQAF